MFQGEKEGKREAGKKKRVEKEGERTRVNKKGDGLQRGTIRALWQYALGGNQRKAIWTGWKHCGIWDILGDLRDGLGLSLVHHAWHAVRFRKLLLIEWTNGWITKGWERVLWNDSGNLNMPCTFPILSLLTRQNEGWNQVFQCLLLTFSPPN